MTNTDQGSTCLIWPEYSARIMQSSNFVLTDIYDSPRAGGLYEAGVVTKFLIEQLNEGQKAIMTTYFIEQHAQGVTVPKITEGLIEYVKTRQPLSVHERADRLLRFIANQTKSVGTPYLVKADDPATHAWSESTDNGEIGFLVDYLLQKEYLDSRSDVGVRRFGDYVIPASVRVTVEGHSHIAVQETNMRGDQAFVAMWFNAAMTDVYDQGIEPAIRDAGYEPFRVDRTEYIDKIDDQIIAEIRRSRFLVADFSHGDDTVRGSVYYEAGFAHGLHIPVIFTCHQDSKLHFDTDHYNHIFWTAPEELREKLKNRILAVIGEGPRVRSGG